VKSKSSRSTESSPPVAAAAARTALMPSALFCRDGELLLAPALLADEPRAEPLLKNENKL